MHVTFLYILMDLLYFSWMFVLFKWRQKILQVLISVGVRSTKITLNKIVSLKQGEQKIPPCSIPDILSKIHNIEPEFCPCCISIKVVMLSYKRAVKQINSDFPLIHSSDITPALYSCLQGGIQVWYQYFVFI